MKKSCKNKLHKGLSVRNDLKDDSDSASLSSSSRILQSLQARRNNTNNQICLVVFVLTQCHLAKAETDLEWEPCSVPQYFLASGICTGAKQLPPSDTEYIKTKTRVSLPRNVQKPSWSPVLYSNRDRGAHLITAMSPNSSVFLLLRPSEQSAASGVTKLHRDTDSGAAYVCV